MSRSEHAQHQDSACSRVAARVGMNLVDHDVPFDRHLPGSRMIATGVAARILPQASDSSGDRLCAALRSSSGTRLPVPQADGAEIINSLSARYSFLDMVSPGGNAGQGVPGALGSGRSWARQWPWFLLRRIPTVDPGFDVLEFDNFAARNLRSRLGDHLSLASKACLAIRLGLGLVRGMTVRCAHAVNIGCRRSGRYQPAVGVEGMGCALCGWQSSWRQFSVARRMRSI